MELPESLLSLNFINTIINNKYSMSCNLEGSYNIISEALVPILISQLRENNAQDYCFAQTIYLNENANGDIELMENEEEIKLICDTKSNRFILYLIDINIEQRVRHSNALLIDTLYESIEYFEPNGSIYESYANTSSYLQYVFLSILPTYKFLPTNDFCPKIGLQDRTGLGICGSFSLLFLLLRVLNDDATSGEILGILIDLSNKQLLYLMSKFMCYINVSAIKYNVTLLDKYYTIFQSLKWKLGNIPGLYKSIDALYYDLDARGLHKLAREYNIENL
ncbi:Hypothetical protein ORPV_294 [Orpheovirus IHUMI-LCC2]|uniref:Uncharacterized protein n=1 Tax=Orpheovirus IHUMI-LCC2 TaxID=2023057 RepID=A0A2I2L3U0_9VIRU|nr:Hypothetical protein ORPV_294 [Orpheovirus IHUMI-LCC2]SNW62198.1 Hypothetical protein ORPV_294 [Orpheovirus IHUMI-LCC2]